jgi:hypothetical protein
LTILPKPVTAGSSANNLTLRFTASSNAGISKAVVSVVVPTTGAPTAGFSPAPSATNVKVQRLTCSSVSLPTFSASAAPPGTEISLIATCGPNQYFSLTYKGVSAPRIAGPYPFMTTVNGVGLNAQPVEGVVAGAAVALSVVAPATVSAGTPFTTAVIAKDVWNNTVTSFADTIHFSSTDPKATLPGDYTFVGADSGQHSFPGLILRAAGSETISATDTANSSISGTGAMSVNAGAADHFGLSAPSTATAGTAFSFKLTALDQFNNLASGYSGTVHFSSSDGSGGLPADTLLANGVGSFSATLNTVGTQTITATDTANSSISGTGGMSVNPGAADHFVLSAPSTATAGTAFSFTLTALDQFNNVATSYSGTVHFTSSDGGAGLPADTLLVNGVGSFSATLNTYGCQVISATDTANSSLTASSHSICVSAGAAAELAFYWQPSTVFVGAPFHSQPDVLVEDAHGNQVTSALNSVTLTITSGTGAAGAALSCISTTVAASGGLASFDGCSINLAGTNYQLHAVGVGLVPADSSAFNVTASTNECIQGYGTTVIWSRQLTGPLTSATQAASLPAWLLVGDGQVLRTLGACSGAPTGSADLLSLLVGPPLVVQLDLGQFAAFVSTSGGFVYRVDVNPNTGSLNIVWTRDLRRRGASGELICAADTISAPPVIQLRATASTNFRNQVNTDLVYVATNDGCADATQNRVMAMHADDGSVLWVFNADGSVPVDAILSAPAVDSATDLLFVGTRQTSTTQNTLFALGDISGLLRWSSNPGELRSAPAVGSDRVYVVTLAGNVLAYTKPGDGSGHGTVIWTFQAAMPAAVVGVNLSLDRSLIAVVTSDGMVVVIEDLGTTASLRFRQPVQVLGVRADTAPIFFDDALGGVRLYVGANDGGVYEWDVAASSVTASGFTQVGEDGGDGICCDGALVSDPSSSGTTTSLVFGSLHGRLVKFAIPLDNGIPAY